MTERFRNVGRFRNVASRSPVNYEVVANEPLKGFGTKGLRRFGVETFWVLDLLGLGLRRFRCEMFQVCNVLGPAMFRIRDDRFRIVATYFCSIRAVGSITCPPPPPSVPKPSTLIP